MEFQEFTVDEEGYVVLNSKCYCRLCVVYFTNRFQSKSLCELKCDNVIVSISE